MLKHVNDLLSYGQYVEECDVSDLVMIALGVTICIRGIYVLLIKPLVHSCVCMIVSGSTMLLFGMCLGALASWRSYQASPDLWESYIAMANRTLSASEWIVF